MHTRERFGLWSVAMALSACGSVSPAVDRGAHVEGQAEVVSAWDAPALEFATSVRDGRTGERIEFGAFLDRLAQADAVFIGETHTDETTHRVELAVYRGMVERNGQVVLAMEMFERDEQPLLDRYLAGEIDEAAFREDARLWSNYDTAYRPMIEFAKSAGLPVVGSNFPKSLRRKIAMEGLGVLDTLEGEDKRLAPAKIHANTPEYWARVDNAVRGHLGMMGPREPGDMRLSSTQTLWDNAMGEACVRALDENPGSTVVHVNGGFHSAYWSGTVRQFTLRRPDADALTVAVVPTRNPSVAETSGVPFADYVVFASERSVDYNEGAFSVYTERKLKYKLHMPEDIAPGTRVPLLIWMPQSGLTAEDGMALWKERLGSEAAIAVIDPAYRETQEDLMTGGRWFWADSFAEDVSAMTVAIGDLWGFLARYYPIDPDRVAVAGEGDGATVVACAALLDGTVGMNGVAIAPSAYRDIGDIPLPLPQFNGDDTPPARSLRLIVGAADEDWWTGELKQYAGIEFDASMSRLDASPTVRERSSERALRVALELDPREDAPMGDGRHVIVGGESPRETYWARLFALKHTREKGEPVAVLTSDEASGATSAGLDIDVHAARFAVGKALPACPGPFGGTTVVVLAADMPEDEVAAWIDLEENDPLTKRSRFMRTRIAIGTEGERSLLNVLTKLSGEKRTNILVVPGTFCADGDTMRALRRSIAPVASALTLHWMPGLGRGL